MRRAALAVAMLGALLWGCLGDMEPQGGTEIPNELVGREILPGKGPAVLAEIRVVPVSFQPGVEGAGNGQIPRYEATTDSTGHFRLAGILPGQYNILAEKDGFKSLRDSVTIAGVGIDLGADTLRVTGTLHGTVVLQPNHDPRSATVQVLGTTVYVNVDSAGRFILPDLAPGRYRLLIDAGLDGYARLFAPAEVRSGVSDTLPGLSPFYAPIPVVSGLEAFTELDGTVFLRWDATGYHNVDGYLVYRDSAAAILPSAVPIARTENAYFHDTLFAAVPKPWQFRLDDTVAREFTYRVRVLDRGGDFGPAHAKATALAHAPGAPVAASGWRLDDIAPFPARAGPATVVFGDRLWVIGGMLKPGSYLQDAWSSPDGIAWTRESESLPFGFDGNVRAAVFQSRLWVLAPVRTDIGWLPTFYASADGRAWERMDGPKAPIPQTKDADPTVQRPGAAFAAFRGRLWMIGAVPGFGVYSTADGIAWERAELPSDFRLGSDPEAAVAGGRLYVMGGGGTSDTAFGTYAWSTPDGSYWAWSEYISPILPRFGFGLAEVEESHILGNLFLVGGIRPESKAGGGYEFQDRRDEVWSGTVEKLSLSFAHAPFGKRSYPGVVSFRGRLWVIGGFSAPDHRALGDIWVLDPN